MNDSKTEIRVTKWIVNHGTHEDKFLSGVFYMNEHVRLRQDV
jgi:hypothetical protein